MGKVEESPIYLRVEKKFYNHLNSGNKGLDYFVDIIRTRTWGSFKIISKSLRALAEKQVEEGILTEEDLKIIYDEIRIKKENKNPKGNIDIDKLVNFLAALISKQAEGGKGFENQDKKKTALFLAIPILFHENFKIFETLSPKDIINNMQMQNSYILHWKGSNGEKSVLIKKHYKLYGQLFEYYMDNLKEDELIFTEFISKEGQLKVYSKINNIYYNLVNNFLIEDADKKILNVVTELNNSLKSQEIQFFSAI